MSNKIENLTKTERKELYEKLRREFDPKYRKRALIAKNMERDEEIDNIDKEIRRLNLLRNQFVEETENNRREIEEIYERDDNEDTEDTKDLEYDVEPIKEEIQGVEVVEKKEKKAKKEISEKHIKAIDEALKTFS